MPCSPRGDIQSWPWWSAGRQHSGGSCMPGRDAAGGWLPPAPPVWWFGRALPASAALPESTVPVHCFLLPVTLIALYLTAPGMQYWALYS